MLKGIIVCIAVGVVSLGLSGGAAAADRGQGACRDDISEFCKDVEPGGGRLTKCMKANEERLSPACRESMAEAHARIKAAHDACADDVRKLCAEVEPGGGRVIRCLRENENGLSPECRERLNASGRKAK